jgi:hypothetical protein
MAQTGGKHFHRYVRSWPEPTPPPPLTHPKLLTVLVIPPTDWSPPIRYCANAALAGIECNSIN